MTDLICPVCKEAVLKLPIIGFCHKPYTICNLSDGLSYGEVEEGSGIFEVVVQDIIARKFFINKFLEMEEKQSPALNPPLNSKKDDFFEEIDRFMPGSSPKDKKRNIVRELKKNFELYYD